MIVDGTAFPYANKKGINIPLGGILIPSWYRHTDSSLREKMASANCIPTCVSKTIITNESILSIEYHCLGERNAISYSNNEEVSIWEIA